MNSWVLRRSSAVLITVLGCALALHAAEGVEKAEEPGAKPAGRVQIENEVVDAGEVVRGQEAQATFVLKNTGDQVLKVLTVKPGCGCTVASFDETIPAGGTGKVTAAVKTENFHGPIEKTVAVTTDDPARPSLTLRIKANVVGSVALLPWHGLALPTGADWEFAGKLIVRKDPTEKGELKITDASASVPWLLVRTRKVASTEPAAAGFPEAVPGDWVLDVSVADNAPKTRDRSFVTFKTGLPREAEVKVPVSVVLETPMRVTPSVLLLPAPAATGKEATGTLSAVVRPGVGKEMITATASPEPFSVRVEPDGSRRYKAIVRWNGAGEGAPKDGKVVFRVGEESITVPVHVGQEKAASLR